MNQASAPPPDEILQRIEDRLVRIETRLVRYLLALGFTPDGDPPHPAPSAQQLELFPDAPQKD